MNTTTINTTSHLPIERLAHYNAAVEQRVQQWLTSGQLLAWIPILSRENFPDVPPQNLQLADQYKVAMRWLSLSTCRSFSTNSEDKSTTKSSRLSRVSLVV